MKTLHITRQLQRCKNKRFELYAITRIIHKIDDLDVKFITQQYVARPDGFALTDLYLPQLKLHIEIDEGFHLNNIDADKIRELDIVTATDHIVKRIDASGCITSINQQVDLLVDLIKTQISTQKQQGIFEPWQPEQEHSVQRFIDKGHICVADNVALRTSAEACNLFGHQYKGWQRSVAKIPNHPRHMLWFPKLYPNDWWHNSINHQGTEINEYCKESEQLKRQFIDKSVADDVKFIVFAKVRDELGQVMYRFKGVFEVNKQKTNYQDGVFWQLISDQFDLSQFH